MSMLRNYLTVGLRSLTKNKAYAVINLLGLAIGLAACLLILLYVRYETSYDQWLPDHERVYQVQATWHEPGQPIAANQTSPAPVRDTIAGGFPQIEAVTVAQQGRLQLVRDGQPLYVDELYVQPAFFDIFQLEFVRGSAKTALPNPQSIVFTETEAIRQFGTVDALGKVVTERLGNGETFDYRVTGVIKDLPKNSHLKVSTIARAGDEAPPEGRSWGDMNAYHYVKLRPGADAEAINAALPAWEKRVIPTQTIDGQVRSRADIMDLKLVNVADVHLGEAQLGAMKPGNDPRTITTFSIVAALILVMASINFINLSTARAGQRAREVALRKVLGASRSQLVTQFMGESLLLVSIALLIALAVVELSTPALSAFLDADLEFRYFGSDGYLLPALGLLALVAVIGGLYPAFYLSRFQPAKVLKANKSASDAEGTGRLRGILVVTQFAISIGLIVCTAVVYSQTRFIQTVDPGFRRDGLIQVEGASRFRETGNAEAVKAEFARVPGVTGVARTGVAPTARNKSIQVVKLPGQADGFGMGLYGVDPDFFPVMGMRLLSGRLLGERFANDRIGPPAEGKEAQGPSAAPRGFNVVINRQAARLLGFSPAAAVGKQVLTSTGPGELAPVTIVGVVEDTRIRTAREEIEPLVFAYDPSRTTQFVVRYEGAIPAEVLNGLQRVWYRFMPDLPFEGAFAEDLVAELYRSERTRSTIFAAFAILAVIIACLGLFGLAAFTTERRTKEIGIRKVLGAKVRDIVRLLTWQFSKPVVIANLIAWPVAWWVMRDWLNTFDIRIPLGPGPFVMAGLLALAIAIGTVAGHAFKVARLNPIHALRYE